MFPEIRTLGDLLPHIKCNPHIRVKTEDNGMTVVCYILQDEGTFAGSAADYARECRGITFGPDRKIVARCLTKFFNIGESAAVAPENLPWHDVTRVMIKRDGSMVTPVWVNGELTFKTKKAFMNREAQLALEICQKTENGVAFCLKMAEMGLTPIFEVTSPKNQIVVHYTKDELTLLHIRENHSGRYLSEKEIMHWAEGTFKVVENVTDEFTGMINQDEDGNPSEWGFRWDLMEEQLNNVKGIEGWVIQFKDGEMVKAKTAWYQNLHRAVTFTRWRDIARAVVADTADDLKAVFVMVNRDIAPILEVEREIHASVRTINHEVNDAVAATKGWAMKDIAIAYKNHRFFGLIMLAVRGREFDAMEFYSKHYLEERFNLETVA